MAEVTMKKFISTNSNVLSTRPVAFLSGQCLGMRAHGIAPSTIIICVTFWQVFLYTAASILFKSQYFVSGYDHKRHLVYKNKLIFLNNGILVVTLPQKQLYLQGKLIKLELWEKLLFSILSESSQTFIISGLLQSLLPALPSSSLARLTPVHRSWHPELIFLNSKNYHSIPLVKTFHGSQGFRISDMAQEALYNLVPAGHIFQKSLFLNNFTLTEMLQEQ